MKVITIGRNPENDIVIDDVKVSRTHLQIVQDDNGNFSLVDFNTTNGTLLNGRRIQGETPLHKGDTVQIGNKLLPWESYFKPTEPAPPASKPKHTVWWIAAIVVLLLAGVGITFKILYDKKQEKAKIEADAKAKEIETAKIEADEKDAEAEYEKLQKEADDLFKRALRSQKAEADSLRKLANAKEKEIEAKKAEAAKNKLAQKKNQGETDKEKTDEREIMQKNVSQEIKEDAQKRAQEGQQIVDDSRKSNGDTDSLKRSFNTKLESLASKEWGKDAYFWYEQLSEKLGHKKAGKEAKQFIITEFEKGDTGRKEAILINIQLEIEAKKLATQSVDDKSVDDKFVSSMKKVSKPEQFNDIYKKLPIKFDSHLRNKYDTEFAAMRADLTIKYSKEATPDEKLAIVRAMEEVVK